MGYQITKIYHRRPIPTYILNFAVEMGDMTKNISLSDAKMLLRSIKYSLDEYKYLRRNRMEKLAVTHNIQMTDTEITVFTLNRMPIMSIKIEEF